MILISFPHFIIVKMAVCVDVLVVAYSHLILILGTRSMQ